MMGFSERGLDREHLFSLLHHVQDGIYFVDPERVIRFWSKGAERISGYSAEQVTGRRCGDFLMHVDDSGGSLCGSACPLMDCAARRCSIEGSVWLMHANGHRVPVHVTATPVFDAAGTCSGMVELFRDATEESVLLQRARELESLALLDPLTGIGNRRFAERVLQQSWESYRRYATHFGVALFDIDHFKRVNDEHGHPAGDAILRTVSRTMAGTLRSFDFLGRWGGEEFLAVIQCVGEAELTSVVRRCLELARSAQTTVEGRPLRVTLSGGLAAVEDCTSVDAMVQLADTRLYCAKNAGRNRLSGPLPAPARTDAAA
jgi:diguanylate cyclase (GGDEF)-like protein/PAS domain S-box-containing protein